MDQGLGCMVQGFGLRILDVALGWDPECSTGEGVVLGTSHVLLELKV